MVYGKPSKVLSEAASADLLDPAVDQDVKDVVEELQDDLTTNIEEVPAGDKLDNHAILSPEEMKESCMLWEGNGNIYMDIRDLMRICEAEEEATGEDADAGEVAADVAAGNDVDTDDLVIVAPADVAEEMIENALMEAKCGRKGKAKKKASKFSKALKDIKSKGIKIARLDKKK